MRFSRIVIQILSLAASLLFAVTVAAQDLANVTISGKVTDQNGAVILGASVTATLIARKVDRTAVTDDDGNYKLIQLPPGIYSVKASFASFATEEKKDLTTIAAQNVRLDFVMKHAAVTAEAVVVTTAEPH